MFIQYNTKTKDVTDDLENVGLQQDGLITCGQKVTPGFPDTLPNKYIPAAIMQNVATSELYQNTGTTASPVWTLIASGGGGVVIGTPVGGGIPDRILYIDAAGNLAQSPDLVWAQGPKVFMAGDPNNTTNGTSLVVSDSSQAINLSTNDTVFYSPAQGRIFGQITASAATVKFGDVSGLGNNTLVTVDDLNQLVLLHADNITDSTNFSLDPSSWNAATNYGTGAISQVSGNQFLTAIRYTIPGGIIQSGVFMDAIGLHIENHNGIVVTTWDWPLVDGNSGEAIITDGLGNLSFASFVPGGTVTAGQVAYGGVGNLVTSDANFLWNATSKIFSVGDLTSTGNGNLILLNDGSSTTNLQTGVLQINATNGLDRWVEVDTGAGQYVKIGDIDNVGNSTLFTVDDASQTIKGQSTSLVQFGDVGSLGNTTAFAIDDVSQAITAQTTGTVNLGDVNGLGNDTTIELNDSFGSILLTANLGFNVRDSANNFWYQLLPAFHSQTMGDISAAFNRTLFQVDDNVRQINSQAIIAGVGGNSQVSGTGARMQYSNAGMTWGFQASNSGGGATIITANNSNWTWPNTDAPGFLRSDGSGVLAFGALPAFADDAAAGVGGLVVGDPYQTTGLGAAPLNAAGMVMIKQ